MKYSLTLDKLAGRHYNLHTHTYRCKHATGEDREYVEKAIEAGYDVLGFSDHMPHMFENKYVSRIRMTMDELEGYVNSIESLKKEYAKDITIYLGLEAEYFPSTYEKSMAIIDQYPLDYMILGQHFLDDEIGYKHVGKSGQDEAILSAHVDRVIEALNLERFIYVAHPDIVNFIGDDETYAKHMLRLLNEFKKRNLPIELNMGGYRDGYHYPSKRLIQLGLENKNDFIIAVDAHMPEELTDYETYDILKKSLDI